MGFFRLGAKKNGQFGQNNQKNLDNLGKNLENLGKCAIFSGKGKMGEKENCPFLMLFFLERIQNHEHSRRFLP